MVSKGPVGDQGALLLVAMVTSARNRSWPGDCLIEAYAKAGLPKPSMVRPCKITTIEVRDAQTVGRLDQGLIAEVMNTIMGLIGR